MDGIDINLNEKIRDTSQRVIEIKNVKKSYTFQLTTKCTLYNTVESTSGLIARKYLPIQGVQVVFFFFFKENSRIDSKVSKGHLKTKIILDYFRLNAS